MRSWLGAGGTRGDQLWVPEIWIQAGMSPSRALCPAGKGMRMETTLGPGAEMPLWGHAWCLVAPRVQQKEGEAAQEHKVEMAKQTEWAGAGRDGGNGPSGAITFLVLSL